MTRQLQLLSLPRSSVYYTPPAPRREIGACIILPMRSLYELLQILRLTCLNKPRGMEHVDPRHGRRVGHRPQPADSLRLTLGHASNPLSFAQQTIDFNAFIMLLLFVRILLDKQGRIDDLQTRLNKAGVILALEQPSASAQSETRRLKGCSEMKDPVRTARPSATPARGFSTLIYAAIAGFCFGALPGQTLLAQEVSSAEATAGRVEEIVVTARRREESLQDVPISITAFSANAISRNMFEGLNDYISRSPNITFISTGSRDRKAISIRGVSSQGGSSGTLGFYIDGLSVANVTNNPGIMDIERIEALRGPQGTYFGRNAIGGAINITTQKPVQEWFGKLSADLSRFSTYDLQAIGNAPLIKDKLAARLAVNYRESDGYIKNINSLGGGNNSEYKYGRLSLRYTPTGQLTIDLIGSWSDEVVGMREGVPSGVMSPFSASLYGPVAAPDGVGFFPENRDRVNFNRPQAVGVKHNSVVANLEYAFDSFTFTSITGYLDLDPSFIRGDIDGGSIDYFYEDIADTANSASQEIRLQSTDSDRLDWTIGAIVSRDRTGHDQKTFAGDAEIFGIPSGFQLNGDGGKSETTSSAVFGEVVWHFNERLALLLGLRYTHDKVDDSTFHLTNGVITDQLEGEATFDDVSPKVSLSYDARENVTVYGAVSKGFKAGGVQIGTVLQPASSYDPETLWNYEVGIKSEFLDRRVRLNATAFYMDWKDLQAAYQISSNVGGEIEFHSGIQNVASATNRGLEAEISVSPTSHLTMNFGAGYVHAQFDDFKDALVLGQVTDLSGKQVPLSARWTLNGDAEYRVPLKSYDAYARVEWFYRDDMRSNLDSLVREDEGFPFVVPSYNQANLRVGIEGKRFSVTGYVENLFDEVYFTNAYEKAFMSGLFLEPSYRTYGIRFTMNTN